MNNLAEKQVTTQTIGLMMLLVLVVIWALNWPIVKIALADIPPLWLATVRMAIATGCLLVWLVATKKFQLPTRHDVPIILSVGLLQMAVFMAFTNLGLMHVPTGRTVILAYTTPLWVTPLAVFVFKEFLPPLKIIGLVLGLIGVLLLFNPMSFNWSDRNTIIGNGLLLLAALAWAICIVHARYARWRLTPLQLMPWQTLVATVILFFVSMIFEPHATIHWSLHLIKLLFYIGPIATALGYWMVIEISRRLPSVTTSLCLLGVPVLSIVSAHFMLGEAISAVVVISMLLITGGLICVVRATAKI
jgi:drug/metabolite transporter (DMT)-like permease